VEKKMSKKSRRSARPEVFPSGASRPASVDFNPDYSYVIKDLRRIGLLAGSFLAILFVLALIIR
jgi:hypothetical protein